RRELVLAAGYGEDHRRSPANGSRERGIGRRVARMEGDDEVGSAALVAADVAYFETQAVSAEAGRRRRTRLDDVFFEIQPDDLGLTAVDDGQQVVQREREVRLARAEVDDPQRAGRKRRENVLDELEKAIDLPELRLPRSPHRAVAGHHAEL